LGLGPTALVLAAIAAFGCVAALWFWPRSDAEIVEHEHAGLDDDDPHWADGHSRTGRRHSHAFVIDALHSRWPA
jgi:hypothetical protein